MTSLTAKGKCLLRIFSWGYPSNRWRESKKAIKASSSLELELPSPTTKSVPSFKEPQLASSSMSSAYSLKKYLIHPQKLALEPLSLPTLVSFGTSSLEAFPFHTAFKTSFFKVFFTASSRNFTALDSLGDKKILTTSPSPNKGSLNIS